MSVYVVYFSRDMGRIYVEADTEKQALKSAEGFYNKSDTDDWELHYSTCYSDELFPSITFREFKDVKEAQQQGIPVVTKDWQP